MLAEIPELGQLVEVRRRQWVVMDARQTSPALGNDTPKQNLLILASLEEDAMGESLMAVWELEPGARILDVAELPKVEGFDSCDRLETFLDALRWGATTTADRRLLQSTCRSGIEIQDYQLDPLVRAICYDIFPFTEVLDSLLVTGNEHQEFRSKTLVDQGLDLTRVYLRLYEPEDASSTISKLRVLYIKMDQAVAADYDRTDFTFDLGFHEPKQGTRFTISEQARREVLQRLFKLNHERLEEKTLQVPQGKPKRLKCRKKQANDLSDTALLDIFGD